MSNGVTVATATSANSNNNQLVFTAGLGYASKVTWAGSADPTSLSLLDTALHDAGNYSCILQFTDGTSLSTLTLLNTPLATCRCMLIIFVAYYSDDEHKRHIFLATKYLCLYFSNQTFNIV